jgi:hypothetical protein
MKLALSALFALVFAGIGKRPKKEAGKRSGNGGGDSASARPRWENPAVSRRRQERVGQASRRARGLMVRGSFRRGFGRQRRLRRLSRRGKGPRRAVIGGKTGFADVTVKAPA